MPKQSKELPPVQQTEKELPQVDFEKIRSEIEELNMKRQMDIGGAR